MMKFYQDNRKTFLRVPFTPPTCFTIYQPQGYLNYHVRKTENTIIISLLYFKASNIMLSHAAAADDDDDDDSNAMLMNSYPYNTNMYVLRIE